MNSSSSAISSGSLATLAAITVQLSQELTLVDFIRHVAHEFLACDGDSARPRLPDQPGQRQHPSSDDAPEPAARRAWRWLTFALPSDLLLAGLAQDDYGPTQVEVVTGTVAALLDRGYAETHLHFGVAFDFSMGWAGAVNVAGRSSSLRPGLHHDSFASPGADHGEGMDLATVLLRAVAVRYLLGRFLAESRDRQPHTRQGFNTWLAELLRPDNLPCDALPGDSHEWNQAVNELENGQLGFDDPASDRAARFVALQSLYNRWAKLSTRALPKLVAEVQRLDPLSDFFPPRRPPGPTVQLQFLWAGFRYLDDHREDEQFARLFWQVERVRCHTYRHCIQRPLVPGLTNFIRFYERKSIIAGPIEEVLIESAALLGGLHSGLESLEVRTSPRRDRDIQQAELRDTAKIFQDLQNRATSPAKSPAAQTATDSGRSPPQTTVTVARSGRTLETGLVLHFLRKRGQAHDRGHPQLYDDGDFGDPLYRQQNPVGYRWEGYYRDRRREADAIANALALQPELLRVLRGLDVCRDEPGVPLWIIAPLFGRIRERVGEIRATHLLRHGETLPKMQVTAHVGEDFVHLASGLRAMDAMIDYLPLRGGDRIGHGLALGVDPLEWVKRTTRVAVPREDHWFNLLWEWRWHADRRGSFPPQRRHHLELEIVRLAEAMFNFPRADRSRFSGWSVGHALEFQRRLYDMRHLERLGFPDGYLPAEPPSDPVDEALERYLWDDQIFHNCRTIEWVESGHEGESLRELQRLVRQRYADLGITIEVNPSSNLLVGDLTDLESHPLWRLAPKWGDPFGPSLRMCVGSDDPFPFATNLREEYQFLYDSLILAGKSPPEARDWLDLIRQVHAVTSGTPTNPVHAGNLEQPTIVAGDTDRLLAPQNLTRPM